MTKNENIFSGWLNSDDIFKFIREWKPVIKEVYKMNNEIKIFEANQIRSVLDNENEEGHLSVVDVIVD